nr:hypothetical protein [Tanacetum cinerariifolium]
KLQKKVKRLEKKQRARTLGMNLFKISPSRRPSLDKEKVSKQGRNLKTRPMFEEGGIDDNRDDINDMVDEAIENVEGDSTVEIRMIVVASKQAGSRKKRAGSKLKPQSPKKLKVMKEQESAKDEQEKEEPRLCLKIVQDEYRAINYETLAVKSLIID